MRIVVKAKKPTLKELLEDAEGRATHSYNARNEADAEARTLRGKVRDLESELKSVGFHTAFLTTDLARWEARARTISLCKLGQDIFKEDTPPSRGGPLSNVRDY